MWNAEIYLEKIYRAYDATYLHLNKTKFSKLFKDENKAFSKLETINTNFSKPINTIKDFRTEIFNINSYRNEVRKTDIINSLEYLTDEENIKDSALTQIDKLDYSSREFLNLLKQIKISNTKVDILSDSGDSVGGSSFEELEPDESSDNEFEELEGDVSSVVNEMQQATIRDSVGRD